MINKTTFTCEWSKQRGETSNETKQRNVYIQSIQCKINMYVAMFSLLLVRPIAAVAMGPSGVCLLVCLCHTHSSTIDYSDPLELARSGNIVTCKITKYVHFDCDFFCLYFSERQREREVSSCKLGVMAV